MHLWVCRMPLPSGAGRTVHERMFDTALSIEPPASRPWLDELNPEQLAAATHPAARC